MLAILFREWIEKNNQMSPKRAQRSFLFPVFSRVSGAMMVEYYLIFFSFWGAWKMSKCPQSTQWGEQQAKETRSWRERTRLTPQPRTTGPNPEKRRIMSCFTRARKERQVSRQRLSNPRLTCLMGLGPSFVNWRDEDSQRTWPFYSQC